MPKKNSIRTGKSVASKASKLLKSNEHDQRETATQGNKLRATQKTHRSSNCCVNCVSRQNNEFKNHALKKSV